MNWLGSRSFMSIARWVGSETLNVLHGVLFRHPNSSSTVHRRDVGVTSARDHAQLDRQDKALRDVTNCQASYKTVYWSGYC
jgi:hypothetical protein